MQVFQKASKIVWYSHLFKNFPQFVVIYTVKGFGLVYETVREIEMKKFLFSLQKQESRLLTFLLTCLYTTQTPCLPASTESQATL